MARQATLRALGGGTKAVEHCQRALGGNLNLEERSAGRRLVAAYISPAVIRHPVEAAVGALHESTLRVSAIGSIEIYDLLESLCSQGKGS